MKFLPRHLTNAGPMW